MAKLTVRLVSGDFIDVEADDYTISPGGHLTFTEYAPDERGVQDASMVIAAGQWVLVRVVQRDVAEDE